MHFSFLLIPLAALLVKSLAIPTSPSTSLLKRDGIADCNGGSYNGAYTDGQGTYVDSDKITHTYQSPHIRKCWQDYMAVSSSIWSQPWQKSSGNTYCTGTSLCAVAQLNGTQVCQTRSKSVSANIGAEIIKEITHITFGLSVSFTLDNQQCYSADSTTTCTWNDAACHTVWTQQQMVRTVGYMRKKCNWGHGDETDCMSDWTMDSPTSHTDYGCGSSCEATNECKHTDGTPCS